MEFEPRDGLGIADVLGHSKEKPKPVPGCHCPKVCRGASRNVENADRQRFETRTKSAYAAAHVHIRENQVTVLSLSIQVAMPYVQHRQISET